MQRAYSAGEEGPVTEMAIVQVFTKLIFGDADFTARQLRIIELLREVDATVLRDNHREMGEHLRNLGVREMIQLVSRLRQHIADPAETSDSICSQAPTASLGCPRQPRDAH